MVPQSVYRERSAVTEAIGDVVYFGVIPSDLVGDRVDGVKAVRKCAGGDLVVVGRVAPPTEPALRGIVEERRVLEVGVGVYEGGASA